MSPAADTTSISPGEIEVEAAGPPPRVAVIPGITATPLAEAAECRRKATSIVAAVITAGDHDQAATIQSPVAA